MQRSKNLGQRSQQNDSFFARSSPEKPLSRTITPSSSLKASKENESGQTHNNVAKISGSKGLDESMMLLAQLELENAQHISTNQSPGSDQVPAAKRIESREKPRPPGTETEKVSSNGSKPAPLRFSMIPPPPLTDLEFWGALVKDYIQILQRLPSLVLWKMRSGVPAPLRGIVWQTISGARNIELESFYNRVLLEQASYKGVIDEDSLCIFPGVDIFRDPQGDGQQMLKRVLRIFSIYDDKISYSRGLAYIVGPLLIYMGEMQAFCVLVRLMTNYNIRDCFLPGYSGLSLRIYQYQQLLKQHIPNLSRHFDDLQIEPTYTLQWFLSFFAVTCPLPMLFRLYDVLFTEGASVTIMRVALSLMIKNEKKLLACKEAQDVTQLLVSRGLWDVYHYNADEFINEFTSLDEIITFEILEELETRYSEAQLSKSIALSKNIASSAAKFLIEPNTYSKLAYGQSNLTESTQSVALSRRSSSEQSFTYSMNSSNGVGSESMLSSSTALTSISRNTLIIRGGSNQFQPRSQDSNQSLPDKLDELLTTLSELQKENAELSKKIAMEKEERNNDYDSVRHLLDRLRKNIEINLEINLEPLRYSSQDLRSYIERIESQFFPLPHEKSKLEQSKLQLNEELADVKRQLEIEISKTQEFGKQFLEQADEIKSLQQQIKEVHLHIRYAYEEKQRLERVIHEMRMKQQEKEQAYNSNKDLLFTRTDHGHQGASISGLRTLQLRQDDSGEIRNKAPLKQSSKIDPQSDSASVNLKAEDSSKIKSPTPSESETKSQDNENENLIVELVQAKTAEAMAREEADNLRNQLEVLKKSVSANSKNIADAMAQKEAVAREKADDLRSQLEVLKKSATVDSKKIAEATAREKAIVREKAIAQEEVVKLRNQLEALKKSVSADSKKMTEAIAREEAIARKEALARKEADELRNQLELLNKSVSADSKDRSTLEPPTKVKESIDTIQKSAIEPSRSDMTIDSVRISVLKSSADVSSRQSGISSPDTEVKASPNSDPTPQKSTHNPQPTNFSRFGLSTNRRVESTRFQSSIRNPESTTGSTNYSSPPISRFGLLSNRRVESNRFQSTADNTEANRSSTKTPNYTSSRLGYFAKLEPRISQTPDQTSTASNPEPSLTSESKSTNPESAMTDANAQIEDKGSAPFDGMRSYFSTSKAELKTSEMPESSPEAIPESTTKNSSTNFGAKPTAPANEIEGFTSASKDETNSQKASERISKSTSNSELKPAVNNSTTEFEISIDASDVERGSYFSVSKAKSTRLQVSEQTPESKPMPLITNSTSKVETKSITPAFGLGRFYSASKTETGKPQVFESTPETKLKPELAISNSTTKSEAKTTAPAFGLGSFFSASKTESKTPQVSEQTSELKPTPAATNSSAKTETKTTAPAFGLGSFFSASKTETKIPQKSEPIPETIPKLTPEPTTNNSTAKIETKSTAPAFGLGSFFSASKTEPIVEPAPVPTITNSNSTTKVDAKSTTPAFGLGGFLSASKTETKTLQTPEPTPKQTPEPTVNNSTTKTETKSSAPAFGFGSFFSASKSESKTPQPSEPTPTPPPPKPVVTNAVNGFWGGWGKKG